MSKLKEPLRFGDSASVAVVIAAHGSTVDGAGEEMERLAESVQAALGRRTVVGYLFGSPGVEEAAEKCVAEGATRLLIVPYFLTAGVHVRKDLPEIVERIAEAHPDVEVRLGKPLAGHPLLKNILVSRVLEMNMS